ncbi:substrate-binding domain-containing protein [Leptolyngbya sp. 7M]|uniref:sugar ABC transporter substrate-binding protein n=1 Tax=Leptolyngbya sp. 7M TaxID=2812896 RepID=UPI001B8B354E|nr:substrate-binding domain-containing protein [Leptolyngbya sp. 7M]QYO65663.1 substrate-binding domain-containing protein [Leptolyngbya sp. 7M]
MIKTRSLVVFIVAILIAGCVSAPEPSGVNSHNTSVPADGKVKIGFAMATLEEERWVRDKEAFEAHCKKMNVECVVTVANKSAEKQANDVDVMLTQGVNVLVIAPHDATQAALMVDKAKAKGVPVISYDRLINSDKIDLYISHQVPVIGQKMAEYALAKVPKGNYLMVYGDNKDNNSHIMKKAQLAVLQPAIDRGDIKIVGDQHATDWKAEEALKIVQNALTQNSNNIQAIIASNDGTASGAIAALSNKGLAGKVLVTGQDAQLSALQSIAEGKQTMTVYKPIIPLANGAVEAAIKLAKKEQLTGTEMFTNDAIGKQVPAILLEVQVVDKDNLMTTVIKDGYAKYEDVYKNVPEADRPPQK